MNKGTAKALRHFDLHGEIRFHIRHGTRAALDEEGEELPNDETAWHEATIIAGELFRDIDGKFRPDQEWAWRSPTTSANLCIRLGSAKQMK